MECMMGRPVMRNSPAKLGKKARATVADMMREVHTNVPSTVERAHVKGMQKEKMMQAIAFSKARKAGARIPKPKGT